MKLLLIPIIIVLLGTFSTVIFIGCGYLISLITALTLFQASLLCIGTTFLLVLVVVIIVAGVMINDYIQTSDYDEDEDDDEEEEEDYDEEDENDDAIRRDFTVIKKRKTGRNEPCPCESGKKYKYCCGK